MNFKSGCGHRNVKGVGGFQIVGAVDGESEFGEFPWLVMIMKENQIFNLSIYQCSGSL
jgi:plasma kallikrein